MDIKLLNGAVVAILGVLVILTPLLKDMPARDSRLNWIAGSVLVLAGVLLLVLYARERGKAAAKK
jgi:drug/metabolite transporter (DMT)-like permease